MNGKKSWRFARLSPRAQSAPRTITCPKCGRKGREVLQTSVTVGQEPSSQVSVRVHLVVHSIHVELRDELLYTPAVIEQARAHTETCTVVVE